MAQINLRESLNEIDKHNDCKYNLLHLYEGTSLSVEQKKELATMIAKKATAKKICNFLSESVDCKDCDLEEGKKLRHPAIDKVIAKLNAPIDDGVESLFRFKVVDYPDHIEIYDANEQYNIDYDDESYYLAADAADEFGGEVPSYSESGTTKAIRDAIKKDFGADAYPEWLDSVKMVVYPDTVSESIEEAVEDELWYKVDTKSHWANSPFFWDVYDYASDAGMSAEYKEAQDSRGNYYLKEFNLYGTEEQFKDLFSRFDGLKKSCKKVSVSESVNESAEDAQFHLVSYYDDALRGVEDSVDLNWDDDWDGWIWKKCSQGNWVVLTDRETGKRHKYRPVEPDDEDFGDLRFDRKTGKKFDEDVEEVEYDYETADKFKDTFDVASPDEVEKEFGVKVKNKPSEDAEVEWLIGTVPVMMTAGRIAHHMFAADSQEEAEQFCEDNDYKFKDENDFVWGLEICPPIENIEDAKYYWYNTLGNFKPGAVTVSKKASVKEDTVKQNGKWVNKGKEGTHGKFRTKKAADAQRKAMFANGYHEGIKESVRPEDAWCGCADAIDGEIYELHTYEEAEASDFHHSLYFSPNALDKMDEGECVFFCKDDNGGIFLDPFDHMPASVDKSRIINQIKKQLSGSIVEKVAPPDYSPSKTGKAYKVFKVKNGKLYPPKVANPGGEDTPIGVWLDAEEGEFAGLSKTGRPQVKSIDIGNLSYRPGWHLGDVPRAPQFDRRNKNTGEMEFPKDFVWAECDYAMDVDYQPESDEQGYMRTKVDDKGNVSWYKSDKYQHSLAGLPKLPKDGYYKYRTNPRPDTVPWVITGQMRVNKLLSDDEVNAILKSKGIEPIHRQGGDKTLAELGLE